MFQQADVEYVSSLKTKVIHHTESDTHSLWVYEKPGVEYTFNLLGPGRTAWFDCGRASTEQLERIRFLIENRIPFNAS